MATTTRTTRLYQRECAGHLKRTGHQLQSYLVPVLDAAGNPTGITTRVRTCC